MRYQNVHAFKNSLTIALTAVGLFLSLVVGPSTYAASGSTCQSVFLDTQETLRNDDKVLAVHITEFLPSEGLIKASTENNHRFGATLHFALGEPVRDHTDGNWSNRPYAVLLPLAGMKKQVLNVMAQDTFVLGDIRLPREAVVLVPHTTQVDENVPYRIVRYDSAIGIKQAVREYIAASGTIPFKSEGGWSFSGLKVQDQQLRNDRLDSFFKEFFMENPRVTQGLHDGSPWGIVDIALIENIGTWIKQGIPNSYNTSQTYLNILRINNAMIKIQKIATEMKLPAHAQKSLHAHLKVFEHNMNLLNADLEIRMNHGKSVLRTDMRGDEGLWRQIKDVMGDPTGLRHVLNANLNKLETVDKSLELTPRMLFGVMGNFSVKQFKGLVQKLNLNASPDQRMEFGHLIERKVLDAVVEDRITASLAMTELKLARQMTSASGIDMIYNEFFGKVLELKKESITKNVREFFQSLDREKIFSQKEFRSWFEPGSKEMEIINYLYTPL